ncbi:hypothetical protein L917_07268, partial [Phytophthora nicotianae]
MTVKVAFYEVRRGFGLATQTAAYPETATEHHLSRMVGCQYSALEAED